MSFFSSHKETPQKRSDIPPEFFSAVAVMSDEVGSGTNSLPTNTVSVPSSAPEQGANPFLGGSAPVENHEPVPVQSEGLRGSNPFLSEAAANPNVRSIGSAQTSFKNEISFEPTVKKTVPLLLFIGGGILLVVIIALGVAYFMKISIFSKSSNEPTQVSVSENQPKVTNENIVESLPFALDKPNYISINTETATPEDIKKAFDQVAMRIISAHMTAPVEFLITDQNNNPIAFSRFAYIEKFEIDTGLLALVEESFSCFVYNDAGQPRMGLALAFKDPVLAAQIIAKKEMGLPYAFRTILYDGGISVSQTAAFRSGMYDTQAVRFVNVDSSRNFSFDYALQGKRFLFGASKDTLRAVIDQNK